MTLLIPTKIRNMVERYLTKGNRSYEMGGYFFGSNNTLKGFLPIPNYADNQLTTYNLDHTRSIADGYARMLGEPILADMHTHPNGTMPSEVDQAYVRGMSWPYHIIIADRQAAFDWFVVDKELRNVPHLSTELEIETYSEIAASEMGLTYLGQVFLTPKGEIVGKSESVNLLSIDQDYYRLSEWLKKQDSWHRWSCTAATRELGISVGRIKKARQKYEKSKEARG